MYPALPHSHCRAIHCAQSQLSCADRQFERRERRAWWRKEILVHRAKQEAILRREEVVWVYVVCVSVYVCARGVVDCTDDLWRHWSYFPGFHPDSGCG